MGVHIGLNPEPFHCDGILFDPSEDGFRPHFGCLLDGKLDFEAGSEGGEVIGEADCGSHHCAPSMIPHSPEYPSEVVLEIVSLGLEGRSGLSEFFLVAHLHDGWLTVMCRA